MSASEIDALKDIRETEKRAETLVQTAEKDAESCLKKSKLMASERFNKAEATLRKEAAKSDENSAIESEAAIAKLMEECEADISRISRTADERRENAIRRLTVLVLEWQ